MIRGYLAAFLLTVSSAALAADNQHPAQGQKATFECEGSFGGTYVYEVDSIDDETIVYKLTAPNNTHRTLVMPVWVLGTSLYEKDYGEGYGRGEMTSGLDQFKALGQLAAGTQVQGDVREKTSGTATTWHYSIAVAERKTVHDDVVGDTEIAVIKEHRSTGSFSSDREAHFSLKAGEILYALYADSKGKRRECHLAKLESGGS